MTTITALHTALSAMSVTGVTRSYTWEPDAVYTADLPAKYVALPSSDAGQRGSYASACRDGSKERTARVVVLVEAAGQEMTSANFAATLTMMDALETALDALTIGMFRDYTITPGVISKNGAPFWAAIAEVYVRG